MILKFCKFNKKKVLFIPFLMMLVVSKGGEFEIGVHKARNYFGPKRALKKILWLC